jgi:RNA polymerase sigma-70 factor (ECF subfamily)
MKHDTKATPVVLVLSDEELVAMLQAGDQPAFDELYRRHNKRVHRICLRMTKSPEDAEELTQDVFLMVHRKIGGFRGDAKFSTWVHRIAVNLVLMKLRQKGLKLISLDELLQPSDEDESPRQFGKADPHLVLTAERIGLDRVLEGLPPGYRIVFWLHDIEGYEHHEIAKILGIGVGGSKSQLHKARRRILEILDPLAAAFGTFNRFFESLDSEDASAS